MIARGFLIWWANCAARRPAAAIAPRAPQTPALPPWPAAGVQQHLHAVRADRHQQQQHQPHQQRFGGLSSDAASRSDFLRVVSCPGIEPGAARERSDAARQPARRFGSGWTAWRRAVRGWGAAGARALGIAAACRCITAASSSFRAMRDMRQPGHDVAGDQSEVQHQLGGGARHAHGAADDQAHKQPVQKTLVAPGHHQQGGEKMPSTRPGDKNEPLRQPQRQLAHGQQAGRHHRVDTNVDPEELLGPFHRDLQLALHPDNPRRGIERVEQHRDEGHLDRQYNVTLHQSDPAQPVPFVRARNFQELDEMADQPSQGPGVGAADDRV